MKTLDKKRDFGTITGDDQGRMYEQDHCFFNSDGTEWQDPDAKPAKAEKADKATKAEKADKATKAEKADKAADATKTPVDGQIDAQLNA